MSRQPKRYARIEIHEADTGLHFAIPKSQRPHYLRLVAGNGRILAHSETYANLTNARRAVGAWRQAFDEVFLWGTVVEVQS